MLCVMDIPLVSVPWISSHLGRDDPDAQRPVPGLPADETEDQRGHDIFYPRSILCVMDIPSCVRALWISVYSGVAKCGSPVARGDLKSRRAT